jgi:hypothetical protein
VFGRGPDGRPTAVHTDLGGQPWSLVRRPVAGTERRWVRPVLGALAIAGWVAVLRRGRQRRGSS